MQDQATRPRRSLDPSPAGEETLTEDLRQEALSKRSSGGQILKVDTQALEAQAHGVGRKLGEALKNLPIAGWALGVDLLANYVTHPHQTFQETMLLFIAGGMVVDWLRRKARKEGAK